MLTLSTFAGEKMALWLVCLVVACDVFICFVEHTTKIDQCHQSLLKFVCSEVLVEKCRAELFRPWIHKFGHEIIVHSVKYVLLTAY